VAEQYSIETRHHISQTPQGYSTEQWRRFAELGIIGALFTEADGGFGGQGFDIAVVFESLGRGLVLEPFLASAVLAGGALVHAGNAAQKGLIAHIIAGDLIATLAHEEDDAHGVLNHVTTRATRDGDHYVIQGAKAVVAWGDQASLIIVSARTAGEAGDAAGISLFLVPADTLGLGTRGYGNVDGTHAAQLAFDQVRLPASALLGQEGQGLATLTYAVGRGLLALAAESLGAMEVCKQMTIEYLQTRQQFGRVIGSFQALQHRMADLLLEIEQSRSAVINAAALLDDPDHLRRERALSAAKYTVGKTGSLVAETCIQLHGGMGVTWELPMPHFAKRLVMIDHEWGDEDHHLARFISLGHPQQTESTCA
jgi:alkylation response protein AidB-like acyl-CoA dehydrogenase